MTNHTPITDQQLDELETLAKNIPAGPWTVDDSRAEFRGSHGNLLADLWDDRLGAYFAAMNPETARALVAEVRRLRAALTAIRHLHKDSPMGPCPVCIDADAVAEGRDGLVPYPCPTGRLAGAQDCDPPHVRAAAAAVPAPAGE